jgi:hypothetical protein
MNQTIFLLILLALLSLGSTAVLDQGKLAPSQPTGALDVGTGSTLSNCTARTRQ